jgi:hypothetical protein
MLFFLYNGTSFYEENAWAAKANAQYWTYLPQIWFFLSCTFGFADISWTGVTMPGFSRWALYRGSVDLPPAPGKRKAPSLGGGISVTLTTSVLLVAWISLQFRRTRWRGARKLKNRPLVLDAGQLLRFYA